ncbi:MAG: hypothetical protein U1E40_08930 [Amaricoccus sp.]
MTDDGAITDFAERKRGSGAVGSLRKMLDVELLTELWNVRTAL